jgi:hypothetical protein
MVGRKVLIGYHQNGINDVNDTLNICYVSNNDIGTTVRDFP